MVDSQTPISGCYRVCPLQIHPAQGVCGEKANYSFRRTPCCYVIWAENDQTNRATRHGNVPLASITPVFCRRYVPEGAGSSEMGTRVCNQTQRSPVEIKAQTHRNATGRCMTDLAQQLPSRYIQTKTQATATLEPEQTQHSKPTFVWAYIARHVWLHLTLILLTWRIR